MSLKDWGDLAMLLGLLCAAPVAAAIDLHITHRDDHGRPH